jgi:hypothetical protein
MAKAPCLGYNCHGGAEYRIHKDLNKVIQQKYYVSANADVAARSSLRNVKLPNSRAPRLW